jgi:hypothetical protein
VLRFIGIAALIVAALVFALFAYAFTQPDRFRIERNLAVNAPPEAIYPLITDLREWRRWSPFEQLDPDMARDYGGAEKGVGATYAWKGDRNAGSGRMEIVEAEEPTWITIALHFISPMEAKNMAIFTLTPEGDATRISWAMEGEANILARMIHIFVDIDKMVGSDFQAGLEKLKSEVETNQEVAE